MTDIRTMRDPGIQKAIDEALAAVPDGQHGAVLAYASETGARLAVAGKIGEKWSVVGTLDREWNGKLEGAAAVRFTW